MAERSDQKYLNALCAEPAANISVGYVFRESLWQRHAYDVRSIG